MRANAEVKNILRKILYLIFGPSRLRGKYHYLLSAAVFTLSVPCPVCSCSCAPGTFIAFVANTYDTRMETCVCVCVCVHVLFCFCTMLSADVPFHRATDPACYVVELFWGQDDSRVLE